MIKQIMVPVQNGVASKHVFALYYSGRYKRLLVKDLNFGIAEYFWSDFKGFTEALCLDGSTGLELSKDSVQSLIKGFEQALEKGVN